MKERDEFCNYDCTNKKKEIKIRRLWSRSLSDKCKSMIVQGTMFIMLSVNYMLMKFSKKIHTFIKIKGAVFMGDRN